MAKEEALGMDKNRRPLSIQEEYFVSPYQEIDGTETDRVVLDSDCKPKPMKIGNRSGCNDLLALMNNSLLVVSPYIVIIKNQLHILFL